MKKLENNNEITIVIQYFNFFCHIVIQLTETFNLGQEMFIKHRKKGYFTLKKFCSLLLRDRNEMVMCIIPIY